MIYLQFARCNLFIEFMDEVQSATQLPIIERPRKVFKIYWKFKRC